MKQQKHKASPPQQRHIISLSLLLNITHYSNATFQQSIHPTNDILSAYVYGWCYLFLFLTYLSMRIQQFSLSLSMRNTYCKTYFTLRSVSVFTIVYTTLHFLSFISVDGRTPFDPTENPIHRNSRACCILKKLRMQIFCPLLLLVILYIRRSKAVFNCRMRVPFPCFQQPFTIAHNVILEIQVLFNNNKSLMSARAVRVRQ